MREPLAQKLRDSNRKELKRFIREEHFNVKVFKSMSEKEILKNILKEGKKIEKNKSTLRKKGIKEEKQFKI